MKKTLLKSSNFKLLFVSLIIISFTSCTLFDFDEPSISITSHESGDTVSCPFLLSGTVSDNDVINSVDYRIDDGEYASVEGIESWNILIMEAIGTHIITIKAIDDNENIAYSYIELVVQ